MSSEILLLPQLRPPFAFKVWLHSFIVRTLPWATASWLLLEFLPLLSVPYDPQLELDPLMSWLILCHTHHKAEVTVESPLVPLIKHFIHCRYLTNILLAINVIKWTDGWMPKRICLLCLLLIKLLVKTPLHKKPPGSIPSRILHLPQLSQKNLHSPLLPLSPVPSQRLLQLPPYFNQQIPIPPAWQSKELGPCHLSLVIHAMLPGWSSYKQRMLCWSTVKRLCHRKPHRGP